MEWDPIREDVQVYEVRLIFLMPELFFVDTEFTYETCSGTSPVLKYLTFEFEFSSRTGGRQVGQITRDITDPPTMGMEEFIDAVIADYMEAAFPKRR